VQAPPGETGYGVTGVKVAVAVPSLMVALVWPLNVTLNASLTF
jgi:hypothetical protein